MRIDNPEDIEIYKIKPWAIYFRYHGKYYLLHENCEAYETSTCLFEKKLKGCGHYDLEGISAKYGDIPRIHYKTRRANTYKMIDLEDFVRQLEYYGFIEGSPFSEEIADYKKKLMLLDVLKNYLNITYSDSYRSLKLKYDKNEIDKMQKIFDYIFRGGDEIDVL